MAKWAMRALLVLSAASMALAVAPIGRRLSQHVEPGTSNVEQHQRLALPGQGRARQVQQRHTMTTTTMTTSATQASAGQQQQHARSRSATPRHATNPYVKITFSTSSTNQGHGNHTRTTSSRPPPKAAPRRRLQPRRHRGRGLEGRRTKVEVLASRAVRRARRLGVTIDGKTVAGSPFTRAARRRRVEAKVPIPAGADGDTIEFTCPKPYIVWEIDIQPSSAAALVRFTGGGPVAVRQQPGPGRQPRQPVRQHHRSRWHGQLGHHGPRSAARVRPGIGLRPGRLRWPAPPHPQALTSAGPAR